MPGLRLDTGRMVRAIFDGGPRESRFFMALAVILVLIRAAAFVVWEHIDFDSDQAIVGLMAMHLSEFRTFPLFFYDQNYMLGVQSWITAPFFWIFRPAVAVLKTPLVILNIAAALLLMRGVSTRLGLRPAIGFVAALPFIVPTPLVAGSYLQTLGSSGVEPLLYMLILWVLRSRPFAFGAVLAVGFLHREFTMYAIPALVVIHAADRSLWTPAAPRWLKWTAAGFGLVWLIIDYIRLHLEGLSLLLQAQMLGRYVCAGIGQMPMRIRYVVETALPTVVGGTTMQLDTYGLRSSATVGSSIIGWAVWGAVAVMMLRLAWLWSSGRREADVRFGVYLVLIGLCTLAAYSLTCTLMGSIHPVVRYVNLALLLPIGCFAVFMGMEPSARLKQIMVLVFALWGTANLADNLRVIRAAAVAPLPNPHRELTDFLLSHQIRYARADYWDAYVVDFLSRERVIVASFGPARIPEYERRVNDNGATAVQIERLPCEGWTRVARWCIQLPVRPSGEVPR